MRRQFGVMRSDTDAAARKLFVALKQLQESEHVLGLFEKRLLPVARDQIDAARAGFTASQNPFTVVGGGREESRSVELDYQIARASVTANRAELDRALGRIPVLDARVPLHLRHRSHRGHVEVDGDGGIVDWLVRDVAAA